MPFVKSLRASTPWPVTEHALVEADRDAIPVQHAAYHCGGRRCPFTPFTVTLAAGVAPPPALDCRCGGTGRLDGAPEGAEVDLPGYGHPPGSPKGTRHREGMDPWGQLQKRGRTEAELAALAAETLARLRGNGAAR